MPPTLAASRLSAPERSRFTQVQERARAVLAGSRPLPDSRPGQGGTRRRALAERTALRLPSRWSPGIASLRACTPGSGHTLLLKEVCGFPFFFFFFSFLAFSPTGQRTISQGQSSPEQEGSALHWRVSAGLSDSGQQLDGQQPGREKQQTLSLRSACRCSGRSAYASGEKESKGPGRTGEDRAGQQPSTRLSSPGRLRGPPRQSYRYNCTLIQLMQNNPNRPDHQKPFFPAGELRGLPSLLRSPCCLHRTRVWAVHLGGPRVGRELRTVMPESRHPNSLGFVSILLDFQFGEQGKARVKLAVRNKGGNI